MALPPCTEFDVRRVIAESGFPFEIEVANVLQQAGFEVVLSEQFFNLPRQRPSEVDIVARKTFVENTTHAGTIRCVLELVIECKDNSLPYVLFGFPAPKDSERGMVDGDVFYNRVRTLQDDFPNQLSLVALGDDSTHDANTIKHRHHQFSDPFRFHQASSIELQNGKCKLNVSDRLRDSLHSLASYVQHVQETIASAKTRGILKDMPADPSVWISFLLLVHSGDHYRHFGAETTCLALHSTLHTSLNEGAASLPYVVDFVKVSALPDALVQIEKTFQLVSRQVARYLKPSARPLTAGSSL